MLIVQLSSGLGNQLFQYACGRSLARRLDTDLVLDASWFGARSPRRYRLADFGIGVDAIVDSSVGNLFPSVGWKRYVPIPRNLRSTWLSIQGRLLYERRFGTYDAAIEAVRLPARGPFYLCGYWQTERYFADDADLIRSELVLRQPLSQADQLLADAMQSNQSVSVHVRRGDYTTPKARDVYYNCTLSYYREAVSLICSKMERPEFYLFSDDPLWCRQHMVIGHPLTVVSNGHRSDAQELVLMSRCHHHIIANSTFSWWGAWLNPDSDKVVIAPPRWFNRRPAPDILPRGWIKCPV